MMGQSLRGHSIRPAISDRHVMRFIHKWTMVAYDEDGRMCMFVHPVVIRRVRSMGYNMPDGYVMSTAAPRPPEALRHYVRPR